MSVRVKNFKHLGDLVVTEGRLVLIDVTRKVIDVGGHFPNLISIGAKAYQPVVVSDTEEISNNDLVLVNGATYTNAILTFKSEPSPVPYVTNRDICKKILLDPQSVPEQMVKLIESKTMKEGETIVIECTQFNPVFDEDNFEDFDYDGMTAYYCVGSYKATGIVL